MQQIKILQGRHFVVDCGSSVTDRVVMDYELDFYVKGERKMYIDGVYHPIFKDSLVFRRPGQKVRSYGDYDCYMLTLDFSGREAVAAYDRNSAKILQPLCHNMLLDCIPAVFTPKHAGDIRELMEKICLFSYPYASADPTVIRLVLEVLYLAAADAYAKKNARTIEQNAITVACEYMKKHFAENLSLDLLAEQANFSKEYFARRFKQEIGISPANYLIRLRLDNAKEKLVETDMSVQEIAYSCGYNNPAFFNSYFKKTFGITPMEYRRAFSGRYIVHDDEYSK